MNQPYIIPMRIDGLDAADLTRMLDRNHARARIQRHKRRLARRAMIARFVTAVIVIGCVAAMVAW